MSQLSTMAFSLTSLDKDFGYPAEYTFYFLTFLRQGCSAPRTYKTVLEHLHPLSRAYTELIVWARLKIHWTSSILENITYSNQYHSPITQRWLVIFERCSELVDYAFWICSRICSRIIQNGNVTSLYVNAFRRKYSLTQLRTINFVWTLKLIILPRIHITYEFFSCEFYHFILKPRIIYTVWYIIILYSILGLF